MIQQADEDITEGCIGTPWGPISKTVPRPDENAKISQFSGASTPGTPNRVILGPIAGRTESPDPMKFFLNLSVYGGGGFAPSTPFQNQSWPTGGLKRLLGTSPSTCATPIHGYGTSTQVLTNYQKPKDKNSSQGFVHWILLWALGATAHNPLHLKVYFVPPTLKKILDPPLLWFCHW